MKISYIIPVYNVCEFLNRCVQSLLGQGLPSDEYEIILVDDGSTDGSSAICDDLASTISSIRAIHQENKGASAARNAGIRAAKGDYIWFVDADDFIESNSVSSLLSYAFANNLDILGFGLFFVFEDNCHKVIKKEQYNILDKTCSQIVDGKTFWNCVNMPPSPWCVLYRRDYLLSHDLMFVEGIYYEDEEFPPRAYSLASKAAFVNRKVYNYVQREGSIMRSVGNESKRANDWLTVADSLYAFANDHFNKDSQTYKTFINRVNFCFAQSLRFCKNGTPSLSIYKNKIYYPLLILDSLSMKDKTQYCLINFSLRLYLLIHRMFHYNVS